MDKMKYYIGYHSFFCSLGTKVVAIDFHGCVSVFSSCPRVEVGEREVRALRNRAGGKSSGMLTSPRIIAGRGRRGVL